MRDSVPGPVWASHPGERVAGATESLFASGEWMQVVETLGARCWYPSAAAPSGTPPLFVFSKGPFKLAFAGFPVACFDPARLAAGPLPERIDILRHSRSCLDGQGPAAPTVRQVQLPESVIPDLAEWPGRGGRRINKDLAFARRHGVELKAATPDDAVAVHAIYLATLARHGGEQRYHLAYFRSLLALAGRCGSLSARIAHLPGQPGLAGFCITARDADRAYYLHGGVDARYRSSGASDLLLHDAISRAREQGCRQFSLMPSPVAQAGLARFKRKWGEAEGSWVTADHALTTRGRLLGLLLRGRDRMEGKR